MLESTCSLGQSFAGDRWKPQVAGDSLAVVVEAGTLLVYFYKKHVFFTRYIYFLP